MLLKGNENTSRFGAGSGRTGLFYLQSENFNSTCVAK